LAHTKLDAFNVSKEFVLACYQVTRLLPGEEKFGMISQIRRAALSVHLNLAEGCSRKSASERRRFYEISRGSLIEVDAALDIAMQLGYIRKEQLIQMGEFLIRSFQLISKLMK
jgi:four helix bundle protein